MLVREDRAWDYAVGMIKVDGLEPTPEMKKLIEQEKRGEITMEQVREALDQRYKMKKVCNAMTEQEYIKEQIELGKGIVREDTVDLRQVKTVAGVDLAYWKDNGRECAVCCIVVVDYDTFEILEKVSRRDFISVPYIPGCLAFREIPLFMDTYG